MNIYIMKDIVFYSIPENTSDEPKQANFESQIIRILLCIFKVFYSLLTTYVA